MTIMTATALKAQHAQLRKAYKATERELDRNYSDELADTFEKQFNELVAHETAMIAAGLTV